MAAAKTFAIFVHDCNTRAQNKTVALLRRVSSPNLHPSRSRDAPHNANSMGNGHYNITAAAEIGDEMVRKACTHLKGAFFCQIPSKSLLSCPLRNVSFCHVPHSCCLSSPEMRSKCVRNAFLPKIDISLPETRLKTNARIPTLEYTPRQLVNVIACK